MAFKDTEQLGRDILELFFEAQRCRPDLVDEETALAARSSHRKTYRRGWAEDARQDDYCRNPPKTEFVKCRRDGCEKTVAVKKRGNGRPREFCCDKCRMAQWHADAKKSAAKVAVNETP